MRVEFHPRHTEQLTGHASAGGDHIGNDEIRRQLPQLIEIGQRHMGRPLMDLGARVCVVIGNPGLQSQKLYRLESGGTGLIEPARSRQQHGVMPGRREFQAQRDGGKGMPGIRTGDHGNTHRPTLPQRFGLG